MATIGIAVGWIVLYLEYSSISFGKYLPMAYPGLAFTLGGYQWVHMQAPILMSLFVTILTLLIGLYQFQQRDFI